MMNIGEWLYEIFGNNEWGMILCIFLIFILDALLFPTLPELFFAIGCMYKPTMLYGLELLITAMIAEIIGIMMLYLVVSRVKIPERVEKIANKYTGFLILGDERLLLLNRVAPMIPFAGAFIAIMKWDLKKSLAYIILGCLLKYGLIMMMSNVFFNYFNSDMATTITLIFVVAVIIISFLISVIFKRREGLNE